MREGKGFLVAVLLLLTANLATAQDERVVYELGPVAEVSELYPDARWLPKPYRKDYRDLRQTIRLFTKQSLQRDGVDKPRVEVTIQPDSSVQVAIEPKNATSKAFKNRHRAFINDRYAGQARAGVAACKSAGDCWHGGSEDTPWAMFLPLGLPMVNQQAVMLLDYPPADSLSQRDYLDNFTMCRWSQVLGSAGIAEPKQYESIVDARPIAAAGSGAGKLPAAERYFDSQTGPGGNYIQPMLNLLTAPTDGARVAGARPIGVFGSPARRVWADITGQRSVAVLETGTATLLNGREVPWIGTNHPDVTTYKRCAAQSADGEGGLVRSESKDLTAACWLKRMAQNPDADPNRVRKTCQQRWFAPQDASRQRRLCVRAKLDTDNADARCGSYAQAHRYCAQHDNDPCATASCQVTDNGSNPVAASSEDVGDWRRVCQY